MRIDALDFYYVTHPLKEPWTTAYGSDSEIHAVITCLHSGADCAWSESSPLYAPTYSPEYAAGVFEVASRFLAPLVIGRDFCDPVEINEAMAPIKGNPFAHATIEIAWWVMHSLKSNKPLHLCLGASPQPVAAGADFGVQSSIDVLLERIDGALKAGYQRVKLKVKRGWDLEMLRAVRSTFPRAVFHIDCNAGYTLDDWPLFAEIDKLDLAMIEQPLYHTDLLDHASLQRRMNTSICLDESINSLYMAEKALELNACRVINLKPGRVGGLLNTVKINQMCASAGVGNWIGGMLESSVGAGICIECASLPNMVYPSDLFPSDNYFWEEISPDKIEHTKPGFFALSDKPGNPFVPDRKILADRTIRHVRCV